MINKKIIFKSFLFSLLFFISFLSFAQASTEEERQFYIAKMIEIEQSITFKINNVIPKFTYINEFYKTNLTDEFQSYKDSKSDFENIINNGICTARKEFNNSFVKNAIAGTIDIGEGGGESGTCELVDAVEYFNQEIRGYISLVKKMFIYKSCNELYSLIQENISLLNSTQSFISDFGLQNVDDLNQSLLDNEDALSVLLENVNNLIISINDTAYENYDNVSSIRQQFLDSGYNDFVTDYLAINNEIMNDVQEAIDLSTQVSAGNSIITVNKNSFYNDESVMVDVSVKDYQNRMLSGVNVSLFVYQDDEGSGIVVSPMTVESDYFGNAVFEVTAENVGDLDFKAIANDVEITSNDLVSVIQVASSINSQIEASSEAAVIGEEVQVTVTIRDIYNNLIKNKEILCYALGSMDSIIINPRPGVTNNLGQVIFTVSSERPGNASFIVRIGKVEILSENLIVYECPSGYVWNSNQDICITEEEDACNNDTHGTWEEDECKCNIGYVWINNICITEEEDACNNDTHGTWEEDKCKCNIGYVWINNICITEEEDACNNDTHGDWNGLLGCICDSSYIWNGNQNKCITVEEQGCIDSHGTWDKKTKTCDCKEEGFVWNGNQNKCITVEEQGCINSHGTWDEKTKTCDCKEEGFVWNNNQNKCITVEEQGCINSHGTWDEIKCACASGYIWNDTLNKCEEKVSGPTQEECENGDGVWDKKTLTCNCKESGYLWNPSIKKCDLGPTQEECENGGGVFDPKTLICACKNGEWDFITKACVSSGSGSDHGM